jgi:hypothetical protein
MAFFRNFGSITPKADKSRRRRASHAQVGQSDTEGGQADEIAWAAYRSMPPSNSFISLDLQKIAHFWIGN